MDVCEFTGSPSCSMSFGYAARHDAVFIPSRPMHGYEYPRWDCVFCGGVNRWTRGEAAPNKCRSCGAPEKTT